MDKLDTAKMLIENCLGASLREITRDSLRMALREIEEYQLSVKYLDLANVSKSDGSAGKKLPVCEYCKGSGYALNVKYKLPCQVCGGDVRKPLLIAFHKWQQCMWTSPNAEITENVVDTFLKSN